jgi:hypothetical protein
MQFFLAQVSSFLQNQITKIHFKVLPKVEELATLDILQTTKAFLATIDASARMAAELEEVEVCFNKAACTSLSAKPCCKTY